MMNTEPCKQAGTMSGMRKFWFGIFSMVFLIVGMSVLQKAQAPAEVVTGYGWVCLLMSCAYGAANVFEHISNAYRATHGGKS